MLEHNKKWYTKKREYSVNLLRRAVWTEDNMVRSIVNWRRRAREVLQTSAEAEVTMVDAILSCCRSCLRWRTDWRHCHFVLFVLDRCHHRFWPGFHNLHNWVNHDTDILWQCDLAAAKMIWVTMCSVDWRNQFAKVCDFSFGATNSGIKHIHRQGTTTRHRGHLWKKQVSRLSWKTVAKHNTNNKKRDSLLPNVPEENRDISQLGDDLDSHKLKTNDSTIIKRVSDSIISAQYWHQTKDHPSEALLFYKKTLLKKLSPCLNTCSTSTSFDPYYNVKFKLILSKKKKERNNSKGRLNLWWF